MRIALIFLYSAGLLAGPGSARCTSQETVEIPGIVHEKPAAGRFVETDQGFMVPYQATIPGTDVSFEMVPVPGGTFTLGSPETETDRNDDEGPQVEVRVEPFWIGRYEVTWAEYKQYMNLQDSFKSFEARGIRQVTDENKIDAITAPSSLYDPTFTYEAGEEPRQPAATMTQYSALQYTKWLSILSGQFYRLPSEAQWEYACRAGTKTAFSFGDDPSMLNEYGWFDDNSDFQRHEVGQKKPNPWGLFDMHGNVAEWVLDQYDEDGYVHLKTDETVTDTDAIKWPIEAFPLVARGGSWELFAEECRSASRLASEDDEWKSKDPNVPKSPWWNTTPPSTGVGFRIVRPLMPPATREERERFWNTSVKSILGSVDFRIQDEGRGARGVVDPTLLDAINSLKKK